MAVKCWLLCVVRRMLNAQVVLFVGCLVVWVWLGWFVGGFDCAIGFIVLGDAGPLLLSPCNTHICVYMYIYIHIYTYVYTYVYTLKRNKYSRTGTGACRS